MLLLFFFVVLTKMLIVVIFLATWSPNIKGFDNYKTSPFHPAIHNFGNTGITGKLHAKLALIATKLIDNFAYDGINMRKLVATGMKDVYDENISILEIGPGVGTLTKELKKVGFNDITAVDTSKEMLNEAKKIVKNVTFDKYNGADYKKNVDVVIISMVMHEMPTCAHVKMINNLLSCVSDKKGEIWIIDIDPAYKPSIFMLSGEPYVQEYLKTIDNCIFTISNKNKVICNTVSIIDGHVRAWILSRVG